MLLSAAALAAVAAATASAAGSVTWTNLHENVEEGAPSPVRGEFTMDSWRGSLVLYGGCDIRFQNWLNDTWILDDVASYGAPRATTGDNEGDAAADPAWRRLETSGETPGGTCGHGAAVLGDRLYVFGGNDANGPSDRLHFLDLVTLQWTRVPKPSSSSEEEGRRGGGGGGGGGGGAVWPPSRALVQHAMAPSGANQFVVVSGTSGDEADDDSAYVFSEGNGGDSFGFWSKVSAGMGGFSGVGGSSATVLLGSNSSETTRATMNSTTSSLLVYGGYADSVCLDDFLGLERLGGGGGGDDEPQAFQPVNVSAGSAGSLGGLAFQGAVALSDRYVVVYGGFSLEGINGDAFVFDGGGDGGNAWCKLNATESSAPAPHFAGGWTVVGDSIYAFGGRINPTGFHEKLTSDLWRLGGVAEAVAGGACTFDQ
jgi:hypothetical protein